MVHEGMASPEARRRRFEKYRRVDPDRRWQQSYDHLLDDPVETRPLPDRESPAVVLGVHRGGGGPDLSVVVIAHDDQDRINDVLDSVIAQEVDGSFEVIVVVSGDDGTADVARARSDVVVVDLGPTVTPGVARNAARPHLSGDFVVFVGANVRPLPGSLDARLRAHRRGWAMVSGSLVDGSTTTIGHAAFCLDHLGSPPERHAGELRAAPARCSYVRFALDRVGWFPDQRAGEDTEVNLALFEQGYRAGFEPGAAELYVPKLTSRDALRAKHEVRGQALRRIRIAAGANPPPVGARYAARRLRRILRLGLRRGERRRFLAAVPGVVAGVNAARRGYVRA